MRLIDRESGSKVEGNILFKGKDLLQQNEAEMRNSRKSNLNDFPRTNDIFESSIFCWGTIAEAIRIHQKLSKKKPGIKPSIC